ncbi:MAG: hypothetical protein IRZ03_16420 [Acidobacterium ailaaui]|nr:hypothetical protein [Pseudacidobacterium ailaaui]
MTMQILSASQEMDDRGMPFLRFKVWMDTTKTASDGTPDPAWIRTLDYSITFPDGITTMDEYLAWIQQDIKSHIESEIALRQQTTSEPISALSGVTL